MKVAIILGTRPEIIKMAPVVKELERKRIDFFILHTGQHYSHNMSDVFFEQLKLPQPKYNLQVGSGSHAEETAKMLIGIEKVLKEEAPDVVLVEGDTNSVLAGALAATKLHIKVGHVEAGLRSYDRRMPEEINRTLTDHCSDYLFAPTEKAKSILIGEGIPEEKVLVTGNTIVDCIYQNLELAAERNNTLDTLNLKPREYFLVTLHRQENPEQIKVGEEETVIVGIVNHQQEATSYRVEVRVDGVKYNETAPVLLDNDEQWEGAVSFAADSPGENKKVEFLLYRNNDTTPHLKPLHLWVDVTE